MQGEGKIRRILCTAFEQLEGHEKANTHQTAILYTRVMLSPRDADVFSLIKHALQASANVKIPPGVNAFGKSWMREAHGIYMAEEEAKLAAAAAPEAPASEMSKEDKAAHFEQWRDIGEVLENAFTMLMTRPVGD